MSGDRVRTVLVHEYVTGGGLAGQALPASWAAEGGAMRRALAEDFGSLRGVEAVMTLDASLPDPPGPWRTVRVGPGEEFPALEALAAEADAVVLVAPESGGILRERARLVERVGALSLGCTPDAIALSGDKAGLYPYWRARGVPTPESIRVRPAAGLPEDFTYPAVLKPVDGAGSVATFFLESPSSLRPEMAEELPEGLLQPFVPGVPLSASFLVAPGRGPRRVASTLIGVGRQRVARRGGRFLYEGGRVPFAPSISIGPVRRAVRSIPGLRGWVGVDFVWDPARGAVTILEINPRVTTSYVGWRRLFPAGEIAAHWLASRDGETGPLRTIPDRAVDFTADGSFTIRGFTDGEDHRS